MLQNYFKTAYRNLFRNLSYTIINVLGLGLAIGCCIVAFLINELDFEFDSSQPNTENVYRINSRRVLEGRTQLWAIAPLPMGPAVKSEFASVSDMTRFMGSSVFVQHGDKVFSEYVRYADSNFFDFFHFPLKYGDKEAFKDPSSIFITEEIATKYFGDEMPVGKQLSFRYSDSTSREFIIGGVVEKIPINSSIYFGVIANISNLLEVTGNSDANWSSRSLPATFVRLHQNQNVQQTEAQLSKYLALHNEGWKNFELSNFYLQPFGEMKAASRDLYGSYTQEGLPPSMLVGTAVLGLLVLLLACFNFTNTSIAMSGKRMKEIGIRKTLGGMRSELIRQFMTENFILAMLALGAGLLFAEFLVPAYNALWPLELDTQYLSNPQLLLFVIGVLLFTTFIAGSYPALYLSKFDPTIILKGNLKVGGTNAFTRVLLSLQFAIAILTLISAIVFTQNAQYQESVDLGYNGEGVIFIEVNNKSEFEIMKQEAEQYPHTQMVAGSQSHVGWSSGLNTLDVAGKKYEVRALRLGDNYLNTMGLKVLDGRDFRLDSEAERNNSVIVNETLVASLELANPLEERLKIGDQYWNIIGVVKDFMPHGLFTKVTPTIIRLSDPENYRFLSVKVNPEYTTEAYAFLHKTWQDNIPGKPFDGNYQEVTLEEEKRTNGNIRDIFLFLAALVLLLSATGLFAMVSLNILKRTKEISIRKVLGASVPQIMSLINREFIIILTAAAILGVPLGYWGADLLLGNIFTYYTDMNATAFLITTVMIALIAAITVGTKVYKAAMANPADNLRSE